MGPSVRIVLGSVMLACALGVAMDLVTANVAVEYFTVHHPKVVESRSPWVMALVWGVGASWWAGLIGGAILAFVNSRLRPRLEPRRVLRMVAISCAALWILMMLVLGGIYGFAGTIPKAQRRHTFESDRRLMAVAMAHLTEYALAAGATLVVALRMKGASRRMAGQ